MAVLRKFLILLWKNAVLQKRQPLITCLEIFLPVVFFLINLAVRSLISFTPITEPVTWNSFQIDRFPSSLVPIVRSNESIPWGIAFTPNVTVVSRVMQSAATKMNATVEGLGFATEEELVKYFTSDYDGSKSAGVLLGVVFANNFANNNQLSTNITYKIRPRSQRITSQNGLSIVVDNEWFTDLVYPFASDIGPRDGDKTEGGEPGYYDQGFLTVQRAIDLAIILELNAAANLSDIQLELQRSPFPPYTDDDFILIIQYYFNFIFLLSFIVIAPNIVKDIALEKEKKLKETMKLMGLSNWIHWCAWFVKCFILMLFITSLITLLMFVKNGKASVINYSNWFVIFIFVLLYATATIFFCFAVSTFFSKANTGAAGGGILFLLTYLPYGFIQFRYSELTLGEKMSSSILHNVAMCYGWYIIAVAEGRGIGLQWHNLSEPINAQDNFTMAHVFLMLIIDCIFYGLIAWYVDAVYPGEFGIPKPLYFPCMKNYWCGESETEFDEKFKNIDQDIIESDIYERNFGQNVAAIRIRKMNKKFGRGKAAKIAVDNLSMDFYENQITAFLGHNGAGKSTTMFMLTGFITPSSGGATVYGHDIIKDSDKIRETLGYCPQHDILFDKLTVEEHLYFYAKLRGVKDIDNEITKTLKKLNLERKRKALSSSLSGGMKRRLSVGIAFMGNTKTVILDEPTSGMDPEARRQIWDILEWERKGRTIILSTHFMEEADYLGDRIAIIARGKLQCCGSSLFLKGKYGIGYHMRIVKEQDCDVSKITNLITSHVPAAQLENNVSTELTYVLPRDSVGKFAPLFSTLEKDKTALGISSFGASLTTMEEVFLKVTELVESSENGESDANTQSVHNGHGAKVDNIDLKQPKKGYSNGAFNGNLDNQKNPVAAGGEIKLETSYEKNTGYSLYFQQFSAMMMKRIIHTWKNRLVTCVQLFVPLGFTIVVCLIIKTFPVPGDPEPMPLSFSEIKSPISPYSLLNVSAKDTDAIQLSSIYSNYLSKQKVGTPFINNITGYEQNPDIEKYLISLSEKDLQTYIKSYVTGASFEGNGTKEFENSTWRTRVVNFFNNEAYHSPALTLNAFSNTLLRFAGVTSYDINAINHPLPRLDNAKVTATIAQKQQLGSSVSSNISFGMAFLVATFVLFLVKERSCGSKHLQFVSGVHVANFWTSTFLWDFINYMIPSFLLFIVFAIFQLDAYTKNAGTVLLVFVLFGWSVLPSVYLISFLFSVASTAFVWTVILNIFSGTAGVIIVSILIFNDSTENIGQIFEWLFYIFLPNYCYSQSLQNVYINYETMKACDDVKNSFGQYFDVYCALIGTVNQTNPCCRNNCGEDCAKYDSNYFAWASPGIGRGVFFAALQGVVFFFVLFLLESQIFRRFWQKASSKKSAAAQSSGSSRREETIDSDVQAEHERIMATSVDSLLQNNAVLLRQLRKYYGSFMAVKGLTFSIPQGECFGLLGVNGAGKTTTFKMLSGDQTVSDGDAYLAGSNISKQVRKAQQKLGYCPQFDGLIDQMTVVETLTMYARLRGVRKADISRVVDNLIQNLQLQPHAQKQAQQLSGGNKRKLSTAMALIGDPPIICLDEPTTGMDPGARRYLWKVLTALQENGRTIILTSHSMEECEALCSRIGIMVNGQLKCLGSGQHLKAKFGDGYTAIVKLHADMDSMQLQTNKMMQFVEDTFPGSLLKDKHNGLLHYQIPSGTASWSSVFAAMEQARTLVDIEDYAISEVSLEQIFIGFAREQVSVEIRQSSCCGKCCSCCCCCKDETNDSDEELTEVVSPRSTQSKSIGNTKL